MKVSIIIITHNRAQSLISCINSLAKQNYSAINYEIIVVDDGTDQTEQELKILQDKYHNLRYIRRSGRRGVSESRNIGMQHAQYPIIAFIDDDCVANKGWIRNIVKFHQKYVNVGVIQGKITNYYQDNIYSWSAHYLIEKHFRNKNPTLVFTNNISFKKELMRDIVFDHRLPGCEDIDFARQLHRNKIRIRYIPQIMVSHKYRSALVSLIKQQFKYGINHYFVNRKWKIQDEKSALVKSCIRDMNGIIQAKGYSSIPYLLVYLAIIVLNLSGIYYSSILTFLNRKLI